MKTIKWTVSIGDVEYGIEAGRVLELARVISYETGDEPVVIRGDDVIRAEYLRGIPTVDVSECQHSDDVEVRRHWRNAWPSGAVSNAGRPMSFDIVVKTDRVVEPSWFVNRGDVLELARLLSIALANEEAKGRSLLGCGKVRAVWVTAHARCRAEFVGEVCTRDYPDMSRWYSGLDAEICRQWRAACPE